MIVQEEFEFSFAAALAAQPDVRAARFTEDLAAAAELKQAAMLQQIEDLQRQLGAERASDGKPRNLGS